jgi:hypothetical protein
MSEAGKSVRISDNVGEGRVRIATHSRASRYLRQLMRPWYHRLAQQQSGDRNLGGILGEESWGRNLGRILEGILGHPYSGILGNLGTPILHSQYPTALSAFCHSLWHTRRCMMKSDAIRTSPKHFLVQLWFLWHQRQKWTPFLTQQSRVYTDTNIGFSKLYWIAAHAARARKDGRH